MNINFKFPGMRNKKAKQNKYFLGNLCKRGHVHSDTGKTLRYRSSGCCVKCCLENQAKYQKEYKRFKDAA